MPNELHIFGYIQRKAPTCYIAHVTGIPSGGPSTPSDVMRAAYPNLIEAQDALRQLTVAMGKQVRSRGDMVLTVQTDER